jgi:hypothetical protein
LDETYVFRRAIQDLTGLRLSPNEPISYAMMAAWIRRIGEILGVEYPTIPCPVSPASLSHANILKIADVSDALRNLAMAGAFAAQLISRASKVTPTTGTHPAGDAILVAVTILPEPELIKGLRAPRQLVSGP